jgi:hypothetical protein
MRGTLHPFLCAAVLVGGLALAGCKQDEGQRCEVDTDCAAGLVCNPTGMPAGTTQSSGVCATSRMTATFDAAITADSGATVDISPAADLLPPADQASPADLSVDRASDLSPDTQPDVSAPAPDATSGN